MDKLYEFRDRWISAVADRLIKCDRNVCDIVHSPGQYSTHDLDSMLYTRIDNIEQFIPERQGARKSPQMIIASVYCGVIRPTPSIDDRGETPDPDEITASALEVSNDMWTVLNALDDFNGFKTEIVEWRPVGPSGGVVGGEWRVRVVIDVCEYGC